MWEGDKIRFLHSSVSHKEVYQKFCKYFLLCQWRSHLFVTVPFNFKRFFIPNDWAIMANCNLITFTCNWTSEGFESMKRFCWALRKNCVILCCGKVPAVELLLWLTGDTSHIWRHAVNRANCSTAGTFLYGIVVEQNEICFDSK